MATAIAVGAVGVYALVVLGLSRLDIWPFQLGGIVFGALLFGVGLAIIGYCPGTGMAGAGEGSRDAFIGVLGMLAGAAIYVLGYNAFEPLILAWSDAGRVTIPDLLGINASIVVAVLCALIALVLTLIERYEHRKSSSFTAGTNKWFKRPRKLQGALTR
jgi:uncharacterized membrane protein YedE/YeeE